MTRAVIAGAGRLPALLLEDGALCVTLEGAPAPEATAKRPADITARFEQFGRLFDALKEKGVTEVVFAGAMQRPTLNPARFDFKTLALAPKVFSAMKGGDDGLLRVVHQAFEAEGFRVIGAHQARPDLVMRDAPLGRAPTKGELADASRGIAILDALAPVDVGQAAVVADGLCLGIETLQGTDAMLSFVSETRRARPQGGVMIKRAKRGQNIKMDMPTIGPETVDKASQAGLRGLALHAGNVLVIDKDIVAARAQSAGLAVWGTL